MTHQLQYLTDISNIVLLDAGHVAVHGNFNELKNSDYRKFLWMAAADADDATEHSPEQTVHMEQAEVTDEVEQTQRINHVKQQIAREEQSFGAIGFGVFKAYFASVQSRWLIVCVLFTLVTEQLATSFVDLFVSKW